MNRKITFLIPDHVIRNRNWRARNRSLDRASAYAKAAVLLPIFVWAGICASAIFGHPPNFDAFATISIVCAQLLLSFTAVLIVSEFVCD